MPNIWTHIIFGATMSEQVNYYISPTLKPYLAYGSQGPDPYFYHNFWPWIKEKPVKEMGEKIHYECCGPYIMEMIEYVKEQHNEQLKAYVFGFISHHILDRNTHPYIIYRSGNQANKHQKLEIIIDTLMLKEWYGIEAWKTPVYKEIELGKHLYPPIKEMLSYLNTKFFPETVKRMPTNYIEQSYTQMIKAWKVLYDPYGWKNIVLKERISPFSHHKYFATKDYLNRNKNVWAHPTDLDEKYQHSFDELFIKAEEEGKQILTHVTQYWESRDHATRELLKELIGNLSYDTGKECNLRISNQYYEPIL